MGEVIRKDAAAADIFADVRATLAAARTRGGVFGELAEMKLEPVLTLLAPLEAEIAAVEATLAPLEVALRVEDDLADAAVHKAADDVWNAIGRPSNDPAYDVLFPGGSAYYVKGDIDEQPTRMALLARLLRAGVHPRLDRASATAVADAVDAARTRLAAKVDASREPRAQRGLTERTRAALARSAAIELAAYKRMLKASGVSESAIHDVIPDRPRMRGARDVAEATPNTAV